MVPLIYIKIDADASLEGRSKETRDLADALAAVTGGTYKDNTSKSKGLGVDGAVSASVTPSVEDTEVERKESKVSIE